MGHLVPGEALQLGHVHFVQHSAVESAHPLKTAKTETMLFYIGVKQSFDCTANTNLAAKLDL